MNRDVFKYLGQKQVHITSPASREEQGKVKLSFHLPSCYPSDHKTQANLSSIIQVKKCLMVQEIWYIITRAVLLVIQQVSPSTCSQKSVTSLSLFIERCAKTWGIHSHITSFPPPTIHTYLRTSWKAHPVLRAIFVPLAMVVVALKVRLSNTSVDPRKRLHFKYY